MSWTNVAKPGAQTYTNVNAQGKEQYDQSSISYDDSTVYYDGVNKMAWSLVDNPSVAWNISTAVQEKTFDLSAKTSRPEDVFFKPDGTIMYVNNGNSPYSILQYALSTAWDVSTATFTQAFSVTNYPNSIFFKSDGTEFYIPNKVGSVVTINDYSMTTAWDISTATLSQTKDISATSSNDEAIFFSPDGTKMHITDPTTKKIDEYNLILPWNISTLSYNTSFDVSAQTNAPDGMFFKYDGTKMYVVNSNAPSQIFEYDLLDAWDISTCVFNQKFVYTTTNSNVFGIFFKPDGLKMYITTTNFNLIIQFSLNESWTKVAKPV